MQIIIYLFFLCNMYIYIMARLLIYRSNFNANSLIEKIQTKKLKFLKELGKFILYLRYKEC